MTYREANYTIAHVEFPFLMNSFFHIPIPAADDPRGLGIDSELESDAYLQISFTDPDSMTTQRGRKWRLSQWMTKSELVSTALMAALAAVEHEARESFTYRGEAIFGPHFDVDALHDLAFNGHLDVRPDGAWVAR